MSSNDQATTPILEVVAPAGKMHAAFIYAGIAFIVGAATQFIQAAVAMSLMAAIESPSRWAVAVCAGAFAGGLSYALPYLKAVLPATPPVQVTSSATGVTFKAVDPPIAP